MFLGLIMIPYNMKRPVPELHRKYVKGTAPKALVAEITIFICRLTATVYRSTEYSTDSVYINTRVLKHLYDKRPAEEYEFLVENLRKIIKYPDRVYQNKLGKRGNLCFAKKIGAEQYFCPLEYAHEEDKQRILVVTGFRVDDKYLEKYELSWSWRDDIPSS